MPRCFVALKPPAEIADSAGEWQTRLRQSWASRPAIRWTKLEQFHLTLNFLGDVDPDSLDELAVALTRSCVNVPPFKLALSSPGSFPSLKRPRVLWLGITGDLTRLAELQAAVDRMCSRFGSHRKRDRFHPHLTLARICEPTHRFGKGLQTILASEKRPADYMWTVNVMELIASTPTPAGSTYETLHTAKLVTPKTRASR